MKTITINIVKKSVMGVVEGLSATIAQHNADADFETLWASDAEEAKLDIYYREAITDLENFLARFSSSTTQQFDLQALADDFTITIKTLAYWPSRLSGVLTNQIQNYLVHAIMAGWLSDFPEMPHADYASMGASDLNAIKEALLSKDFSFAEAARSEDTVGKDVSSAGDAKTRQADGAAKEMNTFGSESRGVDGSAKEGNALSAGARVSEDSDKQQNALATDVRNEDAVAKDEQSGMRGTERNQDFMSQHFHEDYTDWSGGMPPFELR